MTLKEIIDELTNNAMYCENSARYEAGIKNIAKEQFYKGKATAYRNTIVLLGELNKQEDES